MEEIEMTSALNEQWNCENDNDVENDGTYEVVDYSSTKKSVTRPRAYFTSNIANMPIRNALTGIHYPFKVGSFESRQLFKIVDTLGVYDVNGKKYTPPRRRNPKEFATDTTNTQVLPNPNPNHLYYDTPDEFVKHFSTRMRMNVTLQPEFIARWQEKKNSLFGQAAVPVTAN